MEELLFSKQLASSIICGLLCFISGVSSIDLTNTTYIQKGGKFILACQVPLLGIHLWYKDGKPVEPNSINKFHLEQDPPVFSVEGSEHYMTMRLVVEEADSVHTGEYKCNSYGPYSQNVIVVTENMIETNEDEPGMGIILVPGKSLILQCNTTECPMCRVVWFKEGTPIYSIPGRLHVYNNNNSLIIDLATYNDSGVYMCAIDKKEMDVALNATIVVQSEIRLEKFEPSAVVVQGSPLELYCLAKGAPAPSIKWFKGDEEIEMDDERIRLLSHEGLERAKLLIEEADYGDRNHYTCEAFNQVNAVNTTIFIRIKDKLAALWPFLGICAEVAILCTIIFFYERRKSMSQCEEPDTDLPTDKKHLRDQKTKGQDIRQRK